MLGVVVGSLEGTKVGIIVGIEVGTKILLKCLVVIKNSLNIKNYTCAGRYSRKIRRYRCRVYSGYSGRF